MSAIWQSAPSASSTIQLDKTVAREIARRASCVRRRWQLRPLRRRRRGWNACSNCREHAIDDAVAMAIPEPVRREPAAETELCRAPGLGRSDSARGRARCSSARFPSSSDSRGCARGQARNPCRRTCRAGSTPVAQHQIEADQLLAEPVCRAERATAQVAHDAARNTPASVLRNWYSACDSVCAIERHDASRADRRYRCAIRRGCRRARAVCGACRLRVAGPSEARYSSSERNGRSSSAVAWPGMRRRPAAAASGRPERVVGCRCASLTAIIPMRRCARRNRAACARSAPARRRRSAASQSGAKPRWQISPTGEPSETSGMPSRRGATRASTRVTRFSGPINVVSIRYSVTNPGTAARRRPCSQTREIDPLESGEPGVFDRAVVGPVLELVGEQRVPFFAVECLDRSGR